MDAPPERAVTEWDVHEMQVWAAWFEAHVGEATRDGVDTQACRALLQHARRIIRKAKQVQSAWDTGDHEGHNLREALRTVLPSCGGISSEFEHMQHEMLTLVVTIMQQEMQRLYYAMQRHRGSTAAAAAPEGSRAGGLSLPLLPGDPVWYLSEERPAWTPAEVRLVLADGSVMLDVEPGLLLAPGLQALLVRPRASFETTAPCITPWERTTAEQRGSRSISSRWQRVFPERSVLRPRADDGPPRRGPNSEPQPKGKENLAEASRKHPAAEATPAKTGGDTWGREGQRGGDLGSGACRELCRQSQATTAQATSALSGSALLLTYSESSGSAEDSLSAASKASLRSQAQPRREDSPALARAASDPIWARALEAMTTCRPGGAVHSALPSRGREPVRDLEQALGDWPRWN